MSTPTPNPSTLRPGEGLVVTEGGARISPTVHASHAGALAEAAQRKQKLNETGGSGKVKVVQTLHG